MIKIQILGTGCTRCKKLSENAEIAAKNLGVEYSLEKVTDLREIMKFSVTSTPAFVLNGQVKTAGKLLTVQEIMELLKL